MKGWLPHVREHVLTLDMRGPRETLHWADSSASWGIRERGAREDAWVTT